VSERAPRILLTGATGALGRATAAALSASGASVVAAVRNPAALDPALALTDVERLDLADLRSVDALAATLVGDFDAVILNAAIQHRDRRHVTAQGLESTFGVNVLANAWLASALRARTRRVVLVASGTHRAARVRNLGFPPPRWAPPV
jgi:NAD(P)-dependent dehydrogenase (short-subunit alcohol dehydrogenase family)